MNSVKFYGKAGKWLTVIVILLIAVMFIGGGCNSDKEESKSNKTNDSQEDSNFQKGNNSQEDDNSQEVTSVTIPERRVPTKNIGTPFVCSAENYTDQDLSKLGWLEKNGQVYVIPEIKLTAPNRSGGPVGGSVGKSVSTLDRKNVNFHTAKKKAGAREWWEKIRKGKSNDDSWIGYAVHVRGHDKNKMNVPKEFNSHDRELIRKILTRTHGHIYVKKDRSGKKPVVTQNYHVTFDFDKKKRGTGKVSVLVYQSKAPKWVREYKWKDRYKAPPPPPPFPTDHFSKVFKRVVDKTGHIMNVVEPHLSKVAGVVAGVGAGAVTLYVVVPDPTDLIVWPTVAVVASTGVMAEDDFQDPQKVKDIVTECQDCDNDSLVFFNRSGTKSIFTVGDLKNDPQSVIDTVTQDSMPDSFDPDKQNPFDGSSDLKVNVEWPGRKIGEGDVLTPSVEADNPSQRLDKIIIYLDSQRVDSFVVSQDMNPCCYVPHIKMKEKGEHTVTVVAVDEDNKISYKEKVVDVKEVKKWFLDIDDDGYGGPGETIRSIDPPTPDFYVLKGGDADDLDPTIYPGAPELCDGQDNDQDGTVDENTCGLKLNFQAVDITKNCVNDQYRVKFKLDITNYSNLDVKLTSIDLGFEDSDDRDSLIDFNDSWSGSLDISSGKLITLDNYFIYNFNSPVSDDTLEIDVQEVKGEIVSLGKKLTANNVYQLDINIPKSSVEGCLPDPKGRIYIGLTSHDDNENTIKYSVDGGTWNTLTSCPPRTSLNPEGIGDYNPGEHTVAIKWQDEGKSFSKEKNVEVKVGQTNQVNFSIGCHESRRWYRDYDNDGYGDSSECKKSISQPSGYVSNSRDDDDRDDSVYPGAPELCDGQDNDQDGTVDEGCSYGDVKFSFNVVDIDKYCYSDKLRVTCKLEITSDANFDLQVERIDLDVEDYDTDEADCIEDDWSGDLSLPSGETKTIDRTFVFEVDDTLGGEDIDALVDYVEYSFLSDDFKQTEDSDFDIDVDDQEVEDCLPNDDPGTGEIILGIQNDDDDDLTVDYSVDGSSWQRLGEFRSWTSSSVSIGNFETGSHEVRIQWFDGDTFQTYNKSAIIEVEADSTTQHLFTLTHHTGGF